MTAMTYEEEQAFARFLRCRLLYEAGWKDHRLYAFTAYAAQVLGAPGLLHWRGLSREDAQQVLQACRAEFPKLREPWEYRAAKS